MVSFGESSISFEVIFKGFPAEQIFEIMISLCNLMRVHLDSVKDFELLISI